MSLARLACRCSLYEAGGAHHDTMVQQYGRYTLEREQLLNVCLLLESVAGIPHGFMFAACIRVSGV